MNAILSPVDVPPVQDVSLADFVEEFGAGLLRSVAESYPPVYDGQANPHRSEVLQSLSREPFPAQAERVQALCRLLFDEQDRAAVLNAEMGTGKTMMAICVAAIAQQLEGLARVLVIAPPHLVYKWRREIRETVRGSRVWVLNGPDTLAKLIHLKTALRSGTEPEGPEFFILGRVRMRMGFHWRPSRFKRRIYRRVGGELDQRGPYRAFDVSACPRCWQVIRDENHDPIPAIGDDKRITCSCGERLWTLYRPTAARSKVDLVREAMCGLPTVGPKTADRLLTLFGADMLGGMIEDNLYEFVNLMNEDGDLVFSDSQAKRIERALANLEIGFGQGGYQATEFIKRYLPPGFFGLLVVDEGHEYKNDGSAQGQAMAVLSARARKVLLLTGTLMGGYADDLFHLLWRLNPGRLIEAGYRRNGRGSGSAVLAFMQDHGVLKEIFTETDGGDHRTARGSRVTRHVTKAPGFGPRGVVEHVLPCTVFLRLGDLGRALPEYREYTHDVPMEDTQAGIYRSMEQTLKQEMREALAKGDRTLLGVVLNALLAWPDGGFRTEVIRHPRRRDTLFFAGALFGAQEPAPKEQVLIDRCRKERAENRRVLVYTVYTGTRDTANRLKTLLQGAGLHTAVLRASVDTAKREDWILDQVERGCEVLIANPELVKTGLDLLDFPTIVFMQTGYNVYTLQQAARRSWRIGQHRPVQVHYLGYAMTAQVTCLGLMAKKIAVSQSTSGEAPTTGLDVFNQDVESIEIALAKRLLDLAA